MITISMILISLIFVYCFSITILSIINIAGNTNYGWQLVTMIGLDKFVNYLDKRMDKL